MLLHQECAPGAIAADVPAAGEAAAAKTAADDDDAISIVAPVFGVVVPEVCPGTSAARVTRAALCFTMGRGGQEGVELREDTRVYADLAQGAAAKQEYPYQEVRDITDTWRTSGSWPLLCPHHASKEDCNAECKCNAYEQAIWDVTHELTCIPVLQSGMPRMS
eukprot:1148434-Pelagomonas_calceolata.AAC.5